MEKITLPENLKIDLEREEIELIVHAKRMQPIRTSIYGLVLYFLFFILSFAIAVSIVNSLMQGESVNFNLIGFDIESNNENPFPILPILLITIISTIVGLYGTVYMLKELSPNKIYYLVTPNKLIISKNNKLNTFDWDKFSEKIKQYDKKTLQLKLKKNRAHRILKYTSKKENPDYIYIMGINDMETTKKYIQGLLTN